MLLKASAWFAVAYALFIVIAETARDWGNWPWWPFFVSDYLAAALLLVGAYFVLRGRERHWLTAGWGFLCGLLWMGYFDFLREQGSSAPSASVVIFTGLIVAAFLGFALSLAPVLTVSRPSP